MIVSGHKAVPIHYYGAWLAKRAIEAVCLPSILGVFLCVRRIGRLSIVHSFSPDQADARDIAKPFDVVKLPGSCGNMVPELLFVVFEMIDGVQEHLGLQSSTVGLQFLQPLASSRNAADNGSSAVNGVLSEFGFELVSKAHHFPAGVMVGKHNLFENLTFLARVMDRTNEPSAQ